MCILSIVHQGNEIIVTSNRDEKRERPNSCTPEVIVRDGRSIVYAQDSLQNGTWLVADDSGRVAVLLNGAIKPHVPNPPYRMSRGLLLLDVFEKEDFLTAFHEFDLTGIEPFQMIFISKGSIYQMLWDEQFKQVVQFHHQSSVCFFSSTLYSEHHQQEKENWFIKQQHILNGDCALHLFDLHQQRSNNTEDGCFFLNNSTHITKSVSQVVIAQGQSTYRHWQSWNDERFEITLPHVARD
jgi:hypothetical protein